MRLLLCLIPGSLLILEVCLVLALLFCAIVLLAFRHNAMRAARLMTSSTPCEVNRRGFRIVACKTCGLSLNRHDRLINPLIDESSRRHACPSSSLVSM
jgi:hypothetical protein